MKNLYALTIGALLGVAPQVNPNAFDGNSSHAIESTMPGTTNDAAAVFLASPLLSTFVTTITSQVGVEFAQSSGISASNATTQQVDSIPPRITIDTIIASPRPQEITPVSDTTMTTAAPVTIRYSGASSQATQTSVD
ncbi:hypothetical protein F5Y04DRAFT_243297 [Hypomontagnella monticulosa]|nr:hypothetical protein F5Y04DRAFT_243297 [Hypomontagnella monticulosa]